MVGWLVGWLFGVYRPFETVFQSISSRLPKRGRKRRERIEESKNVRTTPTRTYCERRRPLPYCIQSVGRPGTGSLPSTIAPPDHPRYICDFFLFHIEIEGKGGGLLGGPKGMLAPFSNYWGGAWPPGPPSSYAYAT